ncbi:protein wntless homolog isoform X2 [Pomacea canaliculata]|uniref:protein wntless homolog isoform X2 n=1 Tax=Pomacea canaliculata TaxID=400727 RepID=UPI000D734B05|nr:protein wntless homolog isoform X2 [Pomacea canaliculata]
MAGVVLETLSTKKLIILITTLFLALISFFLIGGLIAPAPSSTIVSIPINCIDYDHPVPKDKKAFIPRGNHSCAYVENLFDKSVETEKIEANQIVFSQWLPLPRDNHQLRMSRWFQSMLTVIQMDVVHNSKNPYPLGKNPKMQLECHLFYRNAEDDENDWKELASAVVERRLDCRIDENQKQDGDLYECDLLPFFELGSVHYDYYLINIRLPVSKRDDEMNKLGTVSGMTFITIFQNGGFTKVWFSLKTVFFPLTLSVLIWFWRRILQLSRPTNLLERTLFALGIILSIMNFPLEWITLLANAPFVLLINDIREGAFYAMLLSFWLIFAGEHMMDSQERNKLSSYWKHLLAVIVGCLALLIFDMCERGVQLTNPFYSIWATTTGTNLALAFIILAGIAACGYFLFLSYMIFRVFRNISTKTASLPQMSSVRRKFYSGLIFRFKFLMLTTLLCAALTVIFFIISQVSEGQWKWGDDGISLEYSSAFLAGVYGMWNMYVFALLSLYAPSHKTMGVAESLDETREEEVQLTQIPSESSALASMITKSTVD